MTGVKGVVASSLCGPTPIAPAPSPRPHLVSARSAQPPTLSPPAPPSPPPTLSPPAPPSRLSTMLSRLTAATLCTRKGSGGGGNGEVRAVGTGSEPCEQLVGQGGSQRHAGVGRDPEGERGEVVAGVMVFISLTQRKRSRDFLQPCGPPAISSPHPHASTSTPDSPPLPRAS